MHCGKNEFFVSKPEGIRSNEWKLQSQVFLHCFSKTALKSGPLLKNILTTKDLTKLMYMSHRCACICGSQCDTSSCLAYVSSGA